MRQEEDELRRRFGATFDEYVARVPLFFPRPPRAKASTAGQEHFSFTQYRRNREYRALIGTIAGILIVWLRAWLRARFGY
jgi:hypothetical protein